jgi:hypothetical protein
MTAREFREMLTRDRPFLVKTTDGDTFQVHHRDYAMISLSNTAVSIYDPDQHFRVVAMNHIVSLEPMRNETKKPGRR